MIMATPLAILLAFTAAATIRNNGDFGGPDYDERATLAELSQEVPDA